MYARISKISYGYESKYVKMQLRKSVCRKCFYYFRMQKLLLCLLILSAWKVRRLELTGEIKVFACSEKRIFCAPILWDAFFIFAFILYIFNDVAIPVRSIYKFTFLQCAKIQTSTSISVVEVLPFNQVTNTRSWMISKLTVYCVYNYVWWTIEETK